MTFYAQICTKKSSKLSKYPKLCVVGIQIRKYILRWTCVYRIHFKIPNSKIQVNYTAKVKVVRESPIYWDFTLQQIAMKQHVWAIESYNYSNGTVKAARAICPGNPDIARAEINRLARRVIYCANKLISLMSHGMNLVVAVKLFDVNKIVVRFVWINCNNAWK